MVGNLEVIQKRATGHVGIGNHTSELLTTRLPTYGFDFRTEYFPSIADARLYRVPRRSFQGPPLA